MVPLTSAGCLLALFFTRGVSLRQWSKSGLLSREVALYRELARHGVRTAFFTYGNADDLHFAEQLPAGSVLCVNRWRLPQSLYERLLPLIHWNVLRNVAIIKSNQTDGADIALAAASIWRRPFLARCGYLWSKNALLANGQASLETRRSLLVEQRVFCRAERIVVTTQSIADNVLQRFPWLLSKLRVIPNYVDTDIFLPPVEIPISKRPRLCFVGRMVNEKNLSALIMAVANLDVELELIGEGPLRGSLESQSAANPRISFSGSVAHGQLPERLRSSTIFVLPSFYEGHPKALLEAMSCALPIIATDVSGNREVIEHGKTGWLCGTDADAIRVAIETLLADAPLRSRLGENARSFVLEHCALQRVVDLELACLQELMPTRGQIC
jgi:glycosyltransferase involved in cell wall biosynthesis